MFWNILVFWAFCKTVEPGREASSDENDELAMDDGAPHNEGAGQRPAHEEELASGAPRPMRSWSNLGDEAQLSGEAQRAGEVVRSVCLDQADRGAASRVRDVARGAPGYSRGEALAPGRVAQGGLREQAAPAHAECAGDRVLVEAQDGAASLVRGGRCGHAHGCRAARASGSDGREDEEGCCRTDGATRLARSPGAQAAAGAAGMLPCQRHGLAPATPSSRGARR